MLAGALVSNLFTVEPFPSSHRFTGRHHRACSHVPHRQYQGRSIVSRTSSHSTILDPHASFLNVSGLHRCRECIHANIVNRGHTSTLAWCVVGRTRRWTSSCSALWYTGGRQGADGRKRGRKPMARDVYVSTYFFKYFSALIFQHSRCGCLCDNGGRCSDESIRWLVVHVFYLTAAHSCSDQATYAGPQV